MKDDKRREAIDLEWTKARRAREAAERNASAGDLDTSTNRLYYAAFHAIRCVLLTEDLEPKTHRGVKKVLVVQFVVKGILPDWLEPSLARLETERDLADYAADYSVPRDRHDACREHADRVLAEVERFLEAGGWLVK